MRSWLRSPTILLWLSTALPVEVLYLLTLRPLCGWGDSGELATNAYHLGIAHAPGYPVYLLWTRLWITLFPFWPPAHAANLASAIAGAIAVGGTALLVLRLTELWSAGCLVGLLWGLGFLFWSQAVETEVYTLAMAWLALLVFALFRWRATQDPRWLWTAAFLWGSSWGVHYWHLVLAPFYALYAVWGRGKALRRAGGRALLFLLAGFSLLGYLPLRAWASPVFTSLLPTSPQEWWRLLSVAATRGYLFSLPVESVIPRLNDLLRETVLEWTVVGWLMVLLGLWQAARSHPAETVFFALAGLAMSLWAVNYGIVDVVVYFLPPLWFGALFLGWGWKWLWEISPSPFPRPALRPWIRLGLWALAFLLCGTKGFLHFPELDAHRDWEAADYGRNLLESVPPGSRIVADWWLVGPLWYARWVEGRRPDVEVRVDFSHSRRWKRWRVFQPGWVRAAPVFVDEYFSHAIAFLEHRFYLEPWGPAQRLYLEAPARWRQRLPPQARPPREAFPSLAGWAISPQRVQVGEWPVVTLWLRPPLEEGMSVTLALESAASGRRLWRCLRSLPPPAWEGRGNFWEEPFLADLPSDLEPGRYRWVLMWRGKACRRSILLGLMHLQPRGEGAG